MAPRFPPPPPAAPQPPQNTTTTAACSFEQRTRARIDNLGSSTDALPLGSISTNPRDANHPAYLPLLPDPSQFASIDTNPRDAKFSAALTQLQPIHVDTHAHMRTQRMTLLLSANNARARRFRPTIRSCSVISVCSVHALRVPAADLPHKPGSGAPPPTQPHACEWQRAPRARSLARFVSSCA